MSLILEQRFPLGRFHATRWKQNPFEDPYGEWPPSPWRLLRALADRWFQYAREAGDGDVDTRNALLEALAGSLPTYYLPPWSWRGPAIKQYQPTAVETQYKYRKDPATKALVLDYKYTEVTRSLAEDRFWVVCPEDSVFWVWERVELSQNARYCWTACCAAFCTLGVRRLSASCAGYGHCRQRFRSTAYCGKVGRARRSWGR